MSHAVLKELFHAFDFISLSFGIFLYFFFGLIKWPKYFQLEFGCRFPLPYLNRIIKDSPFFCRQNHLKFFSLDSQKCMSEADQTESRKKKKLFLSLWLFRCFFVTFAFIQNSSFFLVSSHLIVCFLCPFIFMWCVRVRAKNHRKKETRTKTTASAEAYIFLTIQIKLMRERVKKKNGTFYFWIFLVLSHRTQSIVMKWSVEIDRGKKGQGNVTRRGWGTKHSIQVGLWFNYNVDKKNYDDERVRDSEHVEMKSKTPEKS